MDSEGKKGGFAGIFIVMIVSLYMTAADARMSFSQVD